MSGAILLLGGRSEIGLAVVEGLLGMSPGAVVLAQRPDPSRGSDDEETRRRLAAAGATVVATVDFDATDLASHEALVEQVFHEHDVDRVVVAFGVLGDQEAAWQDVATAQRLFTTNTTAAVGLGVAVVARLRQRGGGTVVALSSVAGVRVRPSNALYGASKQAMDEVFRHLGHRAAADGVRVVVVRPGAVATRMVAGRPPVAFTVGPARVASAVVNALATPGFRTGTRVVTVPAPFVPLLALARMVPEKIWQRLRI